MGRVDRQRRQHREDPVLEQPLAVLLLLAVEVGPADQLDALVRQRRHDLVAEQARVPLHQLAATWSRSPRAPRAAAARTRRGRPRPAAIRRLRPATRTMKNSSRLLVKIARKRTRSSSGRLAVLGQLEHPLVEVQPGELAVEEPVVVLLDRGEGGVVGSVRRLHVEGLVPGAAPPRAGRRSACCRCSCPQHDTAPRTVGISDWRRARDSPGDGVQLRCGEPRIGCTAQAAAPRVERGGGPSPGSYRADRDRPRGPRRRRRAAGERARHECPRARGHHDRGHRPGHRDRSEGRGRGRQPQPAGPPPSRQDGRHRARPAPAAADGGQLGRPPVRRRQDRLVRARHGRPGDGERPRHRADRTAGPRAGHGRGRAAERPPPPAPGVAPARRGAAARVPPDQHRRRRGARRRCRRTPPPARRSPCCTSTSSTHSSPRTPTS